MPSLDFTFPSQQIKAASKFNLFWETTSLFYKNGSPKFCGMLKRPMQWECWGWLGWWADVLCCSFTGLLSYYSVLLCSIFFCSVLFSSVDTISIWLILSSEQKCFEWTFNCEAAIIAFFELKCSSYHLNLSFIKFLNARYSTRILDSFLTC